MCTDCDTVMQLGAGPWMRRVFCHGVMIPQPCCLANQTGLKYSSVCTTCTMHLYVRVGWLTDVSDFSGLQRSSTSTGTRTSADACDVHATRSTRVAGNILWLMVIVRQHCGGAYVKNLYALCKTRAPVASTDDYRKSAYSLELPTHSRRYLTAGAQSYTSDSDRQ